MWSCKHCGDTFEYRVTSEKANHSRWCSHNPKRHDTAALKKAQAAIFERKLGPIKRFEVSCSACAQPVIVDEREKQHPAKSAYFCNRACAASAGGKAKAANLIESGEASYRRMCFAHHEKKCVICGERKIVAVHHYDEDHHNNDPSNLVPLCPTHHQYWHSEFRNDVADAIHAYVATFNKDNEIK